MRGSDGGPEPLVRIVVRSRSDAGAVGNAVRDYLGSEARVDTLKGARSPEEALEGLKPHFSFRGLVIVMLGLDDRGVMPQDTPLPPNVVVHFLPRARVRNARPEMIVQHYLEAKAKFRMRVLWSPEVLAYVLAGGGEPLEAWETSPRYDVYIPSPEMASGLRELCGVDPTLVVKKLEGVQAVYRGPRMVATVTFAEKGSDFRVETRGLKEDVDVLDIKEQAEVNRGFIALLESASLNYLSSFDADYVIVPWSGGKDSTAALLLAIKAFGRGKVLPVFVDTGLEFRETLVHVEELAGSLGIELTKLRARVREEIESGRPLPTTGDRWCTRLKIAAIESLVGEYHRRGSVLVVVGDREAESPARLRRPATTDHGSYVEAAPIKLWSAMHVQLYLALKGVPYNPLYDYGFFRIGCYICPALRNWEVKLILERPELSYVREDPLFRRFARARGML